MSAALKAVDVAYDEMLAQRDDLARVAVSAEAQRLLDEAAKAPPPITRPTVARSIADIRAQMALMSAEVEASLVQIEASLGLREV